MQDKNIEWSIQGIWNETLEGNRRELEPRDYIRGSDIGKNYWERYQKMKGIKPTLKFEPRILRVFSAGLWFEDMIIHILSQVGIVNSTQNDLEIAENEKHLRISGHPDALVGGFPDWKLARERVKASNFPEFVEEIGLKLIDQFEKQYPEGLDERVIEIKTVNSQLFWAKKDYLSQAYPFHQLQLYTYLKATGIKKGVILYVSKDDLTIQEHIVQLGTERLEEEWNKDVEEMSSFIRTNTEPPKPESIVFDPKKKLKFQHNKEKCEIVGCYVPNWEVKRSLYLPEITGFESVEKWEDSLKKPVKELNEKLKDSFKVEYEKKSS